METEILRTLQEIRGLLFVFVVAFGFWAAFTILGKLAYVYRSFKVELEEEFHRTAERLSSEGKLEELKAHCLTKLAKYPRHISALFWLGKAHFRAGEHDQALQQFEVLAALAPNWAEEYEPYVKRISEGKRS